MTLTLHRQSTNQTIKPTIKPMTEQQRSERAARPPTPRRWLVPVGLVAAAGLAIGGLVLIQQRDDPEQVLPAPEYPADQYAVPGALYARGVLDGVYVIPEAPRLMYDTFTNPSTLPTAGMVDGVYDAAELSQPPLVADVYSGNAFQPGLPDGEWVRPEAPDASLYPCPTSGPC